MDEGETFEKYDKNPIINEKQINNEMRDPRVFWYDHTKNSHDKYGKSFWLMTISKANEKVIRFYK